MHLFRIVFILLLIGLSNFARAEWTFVGNTVDEFQYFYLDKGTIKKVGNFHYYWRLVDKLEPDELGNFSIKYYIKADCRTENISVLSLNFYRQQMAEGDAFIQNIIEPEWQYAPSGSIQGFELDIVCEI